MNQSKHIYNFMKRSVLLLSGVLVLMLITSHNSLAANSWFDQQPRVDTVPKKLILKVRVTVRELMEGNSLDSVYVSVGMKRGYTNN